jgi:Sec7-like guanine-nucleotide exchange factor
MSKPTNWSFDPTVLGFYFSKKFKSGILDKNFNKDEFTWYAEFVKVVEGEEYDMSVLSHIRKVGKSKYRIMRERWKHMVSNFYEDRYSQKQWECVIESQKDFEEVVKELGLIRPWKK